MLSAIDSALRHCAGGDPAHLTRRAELLAKAWLDGSQARRAVLNATVRP